MDKVYYVVLTIDPNVLDYVTAALDAFQPTLKSGVSVTDLTAAAACEDTAAGPQCQCLGDHVKADPDCEPTGRCPPETCIPETRVIVKGKLHLKNEVYFQTMSDINSSKFRTLSAELIKKIKPAYSRLQGFDYVHFTEFRQGLYADFEVHVNRRMSTKQLEQQTASAMAAVNGTITLETEGLVKINSSDVQPVLLNGTISIDCTFPNGPHSGWEWTQTTLEKVSRIFDGTESVVTISSQKTTLKLINVSGMWTGLITCSFSPVSSSSVKMRHRASLTLKVAVLPQIDIRSEPQFPFCGDAARVAVTVRCKIKNSTERYTTDWVTTGKETLVPLEPVFSGDHIVYEVETTVRCAAQMSPQSVTCVFKNTRNQTKRERLQLNIIYKGQKYCSVENDWPVTKANFIAELQCEGTTGLRLRRCANEGTWEEEESQCVNNDLFSIAQETLTVNIGLGSPFDNSAKLFSLLANATNDTRSIDTVSNLNTSVTILDNMQKLNNNFNESTLNDILKSSSNILNIPSNAWKSGNVQRNKSFAELYLASVERLIQLTNISKPLGKEETNIQFQTSKGTSSVFNVTVSVNGPSGGLVKAAGFKNLINLWTFDDPDDVPNSIVVTASVEGQQARNSSSNRQGDFAISFSLTNPRPHNHLMKCMAKDESQERWLANVCKWAGPGDETKCDCPTSSRSSKSSYAYTILLARNPLRVPFLLEITYVGLAFSVASLFMFLVIECVIWKAVVKTSSLYLRHTMLINISLSLLVGDFGLLASTSPGGVDDRWCLACVVLRHFFSLAQFCWMFCLSALLFYQAMIVFSGGLSKGRYQTVCYLTGYGVPFLIVTTAMVSHDGGAVGSYYDLKTCWLTHFSIFKGSIYSFIIPVGIIVFFNLFSMTMVIIKLVNRPKVGAGGAGGPHAALCILRSIVVLTPLFGVTWMFGFAVLVLDLAQGSAAQVVYYVFSICNSFQVRDTLRKRLSVPKSPSSTMDTSLSLQSVKDQ
ncbi:unnamed protein product [Merluccius merluccius]